MKKNVFLLGFCFAGILGLTSCQKETENASAPDEVMSSSFKGSFNDPQGIIFYALSGQQLDQYSTSHPEQLMRSVTITGLQQGESISGLDFRPATGQLYALGSNSRLYTIDVLSGMASFVAALSTIPAGATTPVPLSLSGTSFGFDFNPVVDRIRIISNTGQNLRAHPSTGVTIVDGSVNPQPASANAVAYANNDTDPATGTKLFAFDAAASILYEVNQPNAGTLNDPLPVKLKITGHGAFDIAPRNAMVTTDIALAMYEVNKKSTLFRIDAETGEAKILAKYDKNTMYSSIAISPAAE